MIYVVLLYLSGMLMTDYMVERVLKYSTVGGQLKKDGDKLQ
jgi:hypothetical protein